MKQLYSKLIFLCLFILSIGNIAAQDCSSNFTVSTSSTPSTCQANGTVTVTLNGDLTNIFNVQYGLTSPTTGFTINPQEHNVLTNIPAGNYTVTVRAFCKVNADYDVVKTVSNVTVGGNYKVPSVSFNATSSRKSYDICNTGIIVLNVTDGSGTFTFNITSAPTGATTGIVTPTKSGTLYTFPGQDYPSGDYVVQINDGCYTAVATFTLGQVTGFPAFSNTSYSGFRPILTDNSCSAVYWSAGAVSSNFPDYYRYYQDGMYEVGAAPGGGAMPTNWTPWTTSQLTLNLSPYTLADFYTPKTISLYTRLKGCPDNYTSITTYIKKPTMTASYTRRCDDYLYTVRPWTDYDGILCYPVSLVITQTTGTGAGTEILNKTNLSNPVSEQLALDYGINYSVVMTDANGTVMTTSTNVSRGTMSLSYTDDKCSNVFRLTYSSPNDPCYPIEITIKDPLGVIVHSNTLTSSLTSSTAYLEYGKAYTFEAVYVGTDPLRTYTTTINRTSSLPTGYTMSVSSANNCNEDYGQLYIYASGSVYWPAGTTFTVTGPAGYTPQTYTSTSSTYYYYMPYTTLPAGTYTLSVVHGCGDPTPLTTTINTNGLYSGRALDYTTENTCSGMRVTPSGMMTYQGTNTTTYYRLTGGPTGYDKTVISPGGSFIFSTPGTYTLGILNTNSANGCVINQVTINYTAAPLALSQTGSSAYECTDGATGVILLQAINGVAPYTYQLWNKDNTVQISIPEIVSSGQVHFDYGEADSTYTARIMDQCGNSFSQQITMARLSTARIVYATDNNVCTGDTIELKCITLGNTAYNWTGPNGFSSTIQSPKIADADTTMTGWYRVTVMPEFCGDPVQDSVYIHVYKPLAAGAVTDSQTVCVRTVADTLTCAVRGGSGVYTYQWQSSTNGTTGWTNIAGATNVTYTPPTLIQSQTVYYHVIVTDRCGTVTSDTMAVNFRPCYIPVNPNIRSRGGR